MGRLYFELDRKADILYHLKRGPIIIAQIEITRYFGDNPRQEISAIIQKRIIIYTLPEYKCKIETI